MTLDDLKARIEKSREHAAASKGKAVAWSKGGPAGFSVIDALLSMIEAQQAQIDSLEKKIDNQSRVRGDDRST